MIHRLHRECESKEDLKPILFGFGPNASVVVVELDVDDVGIAADWTVFDVLLVTARRWIERDHNLFAATVADVTGFVVVLVFGFVFHD